MAGSEVNNGYDYCVIIHSQALPNLCGHNMRGRDERTRIHKNPAVGSSDLPNFTPNARDMPSPPFPQPRLHALPASPVASLAAGFQDRSS